MRSMATQLNSQQHDKGTTMNIFIDKETKLRVNINAPYKQFSRLDTPEIREAARVIELAVVVPEYDPEENIFNELNEAPYFLLTPRDLGQVALTKQSKINEKALAYLKETDWYVTRFAEVGTVIPEDVLAERQASRDAIVKLETP